ncbi:hypothetical protein PIB30_051771 [Stylosanthes scabra]|uniref:Uncharacterized protein n=1 Tax=Stylosanthes scabra TaxID=79078 RepID=A0ABU6XJD4_9FABA|nr:hypothetical protein [Stylosanthes scabra]
MMRRLRLCCEGVDDINLENEPHNYYSKGRKNNSSVLEPPQPYTTKPWEGSVFPKKRKNLKNSVCKCFIICVCGKCYKATDNNNNEAKNNKFLPPPPTSSSLNVKSTRNSSNAACSFPPPQPLYGGSGNYGNETKVAASKWWQMK